MRLLSISRHSEVCAVGKVYSKYSEFCKREIISTLRELENISCKW